MHATFAGYIVALVIGFGIGDWFHMRFKPAMRKARRRVTGTKRTTRKRHP